MTKPSPDGLYVFTGMNEEGSGGVPPPMCRLCSRHLRPAQDLPKAQRHGDGRHGFARPAWEAEERIPAVALPPDERCLQNVRFLCPQEVNQGGRNGDRAEPGFSLRLL